MVAIDRLREVATRVEDGGCVSPDGECRRRGGLTCHSCLADELYGIADQIEREQERESAALFDARVGEEIDLCELFGIEHGDDPLTAIRRHVEGQGDTIENLRLELGDCGASAAWVREHGGIAYVKDAWNVRSNLDRQLEKAQAKVERQQRHIEHVQGVCKTRAHRIMELNKAVAEMRPRVMPEGMEWLVEAWPRFEDGGPVRLSDDFERYGEENGVSAVTMYQDGSFALNCRAYSKGERVKRPTQKVLDADGAEIRVGDTVWVVGDAWPSMKVLEIKPDDDPDVPEHLVWCGEMCCEPLSDTKKWRIADQLTHRAPVLAADGKPLREGEHVYHVETGAELVVKELPKPGAYQAVVVFAPPASHLTSFDPDRLTHERPDSWERLEEDAKAEPGEYCVTYELSAAYMGGEAEEYAKAEDLVRRAMALAGRDA